MAPATHVAMKRLCYTYTYSFCKTYNCGNAVENCGEYFWQLWLLRHTLQSKVFVTLVRFTLVKRTSMTIIYTVYINYAKTI